MKFLYVPFLTTMVTLNIFILASRLAPTLSLSLFVKPRVLVLSLDSKPKTSEFVDYVPCDFLLITSFKTVLLARSTEMTPSGVK